MLHRFGAKRSGAEQSGDDHHQQSCVLFCIDNAASLVDMFCEPQWKFVLCDNQFEPVALVSFAACSICWTWVVARRLAFEQGARRLANFVAVDSTVGPDSRALDSSNRVTRIHSHSFAFIKKRVSPFWLCLCWRLAECDCLSTSVMLYIFGADDDDFFPKKMMVFETSHRVTSYHFGLLIYLEWVVVVFCPEA